MEKAIETDWRCQSTTWKFLQKVVIAVYWQMEGCERKEKKLEKSFSLLNFWCARSHIYIQMTNTPTHTHTHTDTFTTTITADKIESMTVSKHAHHTKYQILHHHLEAYFVFCTNIRMQSMHADFNLRLLFRL